MRKLSVRQKKIVDEWFEKTWTGAGGVIGVADIPQDVYNKIERISDHETLWTDLERYITDKALKKMYG